MSDEIDDTDDDGDDDGALTPEEEAEQAYEDATKRGQMYRALRRLGAGGNTTYAVAPALLAAKATAVFEASGITTHGGDPGAIGKLMLSLQRFLEAVDAHVWLTSLQFGNSVTLEFEPRVSDAQRDEIERLAEERGDEEVSDRELGVVVPEALAGLEAAVRILNEPPDQVADRVRVISVKAREELRKLSDALEQQKATLTLTSPRDEEVTLEPRRAAQYARRLRAAEEAEPIVITIVGKLTRTDSEVNQFRVVLDRRRLPPELDGRRKAIEGGYSSQASRQVREGGLWDTKVTARVRVRMSVPPGGGKPRPEQFSFVSVQPFAE